MIVTNGTKNGEYIFTMHKMYKFKKLFSYCLLIWVFKRDNLPKDNPRISSFQSTAEGVVQSIQEHLHRNPFCFHVKVTQNGVKPFLYETVTKSCFYVDL